MWVRLPAQHIMVISMERESRRDKQAGDIMLVRLPAPNIMVISREREKRRVKERERERERSFCILKCPDLYL